MASSQKMNTKTNTSQNISSKFDIKKSSVINRKAPEVRQTLTSKYRLLKANPLLKYELEGKDLSELLTNKDRNLSLSSLSNKSLNLFPIKPSTVTSNRTKMSFVKENKKLLAKPTQNRISNNKQSTNTKTTTSIGNNTRKTNLITNKTQPVNSKNNEFKKPDPKIKPPVAANRLLSKTLNNSNQSNGKPTNPQPIRRSLSAEYFLKKQQQTSQLVKNNNNKRDSNNSFKSLNHQVNKSQTIQPMKFKSPSAYVRRSVKTLETPNQGLRKSSVSSSKSGPPLHELEKRLNDWLRKRGKSVSSFHHLKCFGVKAIEEENKENVEVVEDLTKGSYEDLNISKPKDLDSSTKTAQENLKATVKDALMDLHKLIIEGYDGKQCEAWLDLIHEHYEDIQDEPEYWECRAAIEQTRGDITSAVECYKTAIVHGAEVNAVDKSLDFLLQKFSLLNINTTEKNNKKKSNNQKILQDARNIFKSSIIQFAVQERMLKKKDKKEPIKTFIATPVRRSTRISRGMYSNTPGIKICSTLLELDSPIKETISFRCNTAL